MNQVAVPLIELDVSTRAFNSLKSAGIRTANQLSAWRAEDLLAIPYLGAGQLAEIEQALAEVGLALRPAFQRTGPSARQIAQRARRQREKALRSAEADNPEAQISAWLNARHRAG